MTQLELPITAAINVPPALKELISIHATYELYTEKSVECGSSEDHGFCDEDGNVLTDSEDDLQNLSDEQNALIELYDADSVCDGWTGLVELIESLLMLSYYEPSCSPMNISDTAQDFWFSGHAGDPDMTTGDYNCYSVHFKIKNNFVLKTICSIFEQNEITETQKEQLTFYEQNLWASVYGVELECF